MIEFLVAGAIKVDMSLLLPWPDWGWRRFLVIDVQHSKEFALLTVRPTDGDDCSIEQHIARGVLEPMHVVNKATRIHTQSPALMQKRESARRTKGLVEYSFPDATESTPAHLRATCEHCLREFVRPHLKGAVPKRCSSVCVKLATGRSQGVPDAVGVEVPVGAGAGGDSGEDPGLSDGSLLPSP